ncbi:MAG: membrane protein insertase YidC [Treponema sp.]|nr:membrane protein insertase YidC [Treponema sp.]
MEKNTLLAIVLMTLVLIISFIWQGQRFAQRQQLEEPAVEIQDITPTTNEATTDTSNQASVSQNDQTQIAQTPEQTAASETVQQVPQDVIELQPPQIIETELYRAVLTNAGGNMTSFIWKDQRKKDGDPDRYVELILSGDKEANAFLITSGDLDTGNYNFNVNRLSEYSVEFSRYFSVPSASQDSDGRFLLTKRYDFKPNEFMFELTVIIDGGFHVQGIDTYTLSFGPQIGPVFERLDTHYEDYRRYITFTNGKRRDEKANEQLIDYNPTWSAITGKYFTFIAIPLTQYTMNFSDKDEPGIPAASRLNIIRPASGISKVEDTFRFYLGPKTQEILVNYNTGRNEFGIRDMNLVEVTNTRGFFGIFSPLEKGLKWLLLGINRVVPNYGISIILLTLLIKILFFPLTKKGSEATQRMQALAPKIKEIQDKHKGNPQKLQAEMANFYKQEGYNPISGCLPMLLQIPIFIAMFSLFNNHFDLRGAGFIPGWIPDLSIPEYIVQFEYFRVPILGWTALRALPFIYVASQLLYGKVTQMPGQQSNAQMKMMLYIMPIVFFFVLYNVPSGLLIYWISSNVLTLVQQILINRYIIAKRAALAQAEPAADVFNKKPDRPVIAPGKKKKRK